MGEYKPSADLDFTKKFIQFNTDLEFDKVSEGGKVNVTLPVLQVVAEAVYFVGLVQANTAITLPLPIITAEAEYESNVWRGLFGRGENYSETAKLANIAVLNKREKSENLSSINLFAQEKARYIHNSIYTFSQLSERVSNQLKFGVEEARYLQNSIKSGFENLDFIRIKVRINSELTTPVNQAWRSDFAPMQKVSNKTAVNQESARYLDTSVINKAKVAKWLRDGYKVGFEVARPVPYATGTITENDENNAKSQYKPSADLNFSCRWVAPSTSLNFGAKCQPQVGLSIQYDEVIFVSNSISLTNLDTGKGIAIYSGNIGIDNKAYCWSLSAEIAYFETIEKGTLVELVINGETWRFIIDEISEGRQFGETTINISGKSQALLLAYPFVDLRGYKYDQPTSATQIAQDEIDRVGGFSLDWRLIASNGWLVPANAYSYTQYTPIQVIQDIANAGGGFVNAHPSEKKLIIKSDYPVASWQWASLKPDIVIPDSLIWSKGDTYTEKPNYNGVWVSSDKDNGVQGFIRRKGTDGSNTPDQVIHSAITEQSVAIHRGICELSQAGITQSISLNTPLHKDIGVLTPSDFVTVSVAGVGQNAIVRGVSINFSMSNDGKLDIQNQLKLETKIV